MKIALYYRTTTQQVYWTDAEGEVHYDLVETPGEFRIDPTENTVNEMRLVFGRVESPMKVTAHLEEMALNLVEWFGYFGAHFGAHYFGARLSTSLDRVDEGVASSEDASSLQDGAEVKAG